MQAVCDLERKLHIWTKSATVKRDLRGKNTGA
jgi:hypothetical protein